LYSYIILLFGISSAWPLTGGDWKCGSRKWE